MPLSDETIRARSGFFGGRKAKPPRDGPLFIPSISDTAQPRRRMPRHGLEDATRARHARRSRARQPLLLPARALVLRASMSAASIGSPPDEERARRGGLLASHRHQTHQAGHHSPMVVVD